MKQQKKFGLFLVCATLVCLSRVPAFAAPPDVDANGVWTIKAAGRDLWDDADGGIIIYMKHTGDGRSLFRLLSPIRSLYVTGEDIGRAMIRATRENLRGRIIENPEIRRLAEAGGLP